MKASPITSTAPLTTGTAPQEATLSKTDWKVHALVVLSYLLVGIGMILAFSSFYLAFTVNPMIAAAAPSLPIALGVFGLQYASNPGNSPKPVEQVLAAAPVERPPIGIGNKEHNCWINVSLQLLFNVPAYKRAMEKVLESTDKELAPLRDVYLAYLRGEEVDSQKIRGWLHGLKPDKVLIESSQQLSYEECLEFILYKIGYSLPKEIRHQIIWEGKQARPLRIPSSPSCTFELTRHLLQKGYDVAKALDDYFYNEFISEKGRAEHNLLTLEKAPDDFGVKHCTATSIEEKEPEDSEEEEDLSLKGAMATRLTARQVGKEVHYFCDSFIHHEKTETKGVGHWIAYLYKNGQWWKASDSIVYQVDLKEIEEKIATASFIHYTNGREMEIKPHPLLLKELAPAGIRNASANCWANSIIQFFSMAPSITRYLFSLSHDRCSAFVSLLQNYYKAQVQAKEVADTVDSQLLRVSLDNVPKSVHEHVCAGQGIEEIFDKAGFQYRMQQEYHSKSGVSITEPPGIQRIDLDLMTPARDFKKLFFDFFTTPLEEGTLKMLKFVDPPEDLIIKALRYGQQGVNNDFSGRDIRDDISGIPEQFELPKEFTVANRQGIQYELNGCIIQRGSLRSGHYVCLVKKKDGWYLMNDSSRELISKEEANDYFKQGYFFLYSKIENTKHTS